jgi:GNAT superfamily N-acetyltransferase
MLATDLKAVGRIGHMMHADFPERASVVAERLSLFPAGCWMTEGGYVIAHPTRLGAPPALDTLLRSLADGADTLHVHDVALLPHMQGQGLGGAALKLLTGVAGRHGLARLSLVAVHGTPPYWARFGFQDAPAGPTLASYGPEARYMVRSVMI